MSPETVFASHLSSVPYFDSVIPLKLYRTKFAVNIFADMVQVKAINPLPTIPPKSDGGVITGFSKKSRKRMIEFMAKQHDIPDLFVTLTWSDDVASLDPEIFRKHFEAFRRRLERAYVGIRAIWKLEIEARKSGDRHGELLPHYHLLVWLPKDSPETLKIALSDDFGQLWRGWWHEIVGSNHAEHLRRRGCEVQRIKSRKHAYHYVAKYAAKTYNFGLSLGRVWGRIGTFNTNPDMTLELLQREYVHFKRLLAAFIKSREQKYHKKFRRQSSRKGVSVFGLGSISQSLGTIEKTTVMRMVHHAKQLHRDEKSLLMRSRSSTLITD